MTEAGDHVLPPLFVGAIRPLGHRDAVRSWEHRWGEATVRLVCGEPDERGQPCRTKIGCVSKGDERQGPLVQTFIADPQDVTASDRDDDILARTGEHDTAVSVWCLHDNGSAGWRGPYTTRCVKNHRHALDDRGRHRLQGAVRQGMREVVFPLHRGSRRRRE